MEPYKILVVDDNADYLSRIIDLMNETDKSFTFFQAFNGEIACSVAEKKLPDLIITDWEMPVMDGIEFVKYLKSKEITKDIPVIMCTGVMTEVENLKTALDAGAVDYIRKPVEKQELIARVHSMLKLSQSMKKIKEQNLLLQQQNEKIEAQNHELIKQKKHITDSINYALNIQNAILPKPDFVTKVLPEHFILSKPCDIVSGDFYYIKQTQKLTIIAAADCTGHGVPGAFLSMLCYALLNEIVLNKEINSANLVLENLRTLLKSSLQQTGEFDEPQDGLDIAFCAINNETLEMNFAGAFNPCFVFRSMNNDRVQLSILEADNQPVGVYLKELPFTENKIQLQAGDTFYIFSDGYESQFGGNCLQTFQPLKFKELLAEIHQLPMPEQKEILEQRFIKWKGKEPQTDDVLIIGVRV